jgi:hypothetical protein
VTAGTVFADTHSLLRTWFATALYVTGQKQGVSALGLQPVLGLGSYATAWSWLHKLRRAMVPTWPGSGVRRCRDGRDIRGRPPEPWAFDRRAISKASVAIAVERRGRVKLEKSVEEQAAMSGTASVEKRKVNSSR